MSFEPFLTSSIQRQSPALISPISPSREELTIHVPFEIRFGEKKDKRELVVHIATKPLQPSNKLFHIIELKDESEFDFLYVMELAEQDFTKFKERFRLNLSFEEFPTFFARDLESTKSDSLSISTSVADFNQLSAKSSASLTLNEHCTEATFILTQTQQYRNLELYRLDFKRPTDIHIIKYVVGQVAHWKTLALERQTKIDNQVQSLEEESSTLESLQRELAAIQSEHRIELSQANERTKLESADLVQKYETRYSEQIQAHQQEVSQLREKILSLETDKSSNLASINSNENRIRELTEQLESRTSELKTVRARFDTTEKEKNDLAARFSELQSTHSNLMLTCASLEQQINDRKERLVENETRIAQTNDFKQTLEGSIRELKEEITRLKKKLSAQAKEIEKGNGIIDNMWHEREELIRDVDELNDTITQHQNDLDSLQGAIHDKEDEIRELKRTLDDTNRSLTRTTQDYEKAEKDKKELAERVKVLTDVQERLAQQLTEKQLKERDEERKGFGMTSLGDTLLGKQRDDWQSRLGASSRFGDTNPRPMLEEADLLHSRVFGERTSRLRTDTQSQSPSIPVTHTRDTSHRALRSTSALRSGRTSTSPLPPPPVLPDLTALNKNLPIFPALSTSTLTERNTSNTQPKSDPLTRTKDPLSSDFRSHPLDKIVQPNTSPTGQFPSNKSPLSPTTQPPSSFQPQSHSFEAPYSSQQNIQPSSPTIPPPSHTLPQPRPTFQSSLLSSLPITQSYLQQSQHLITPTQAPSTETSQSKPTPSANPQSEHSPVMATESMIFQGTPSENIATATTQRTTFSAARPPSAPRRSRIGTKYQSLD